MKPLIFIFALIPAWTLALAQSSDSLSEYKQITEFISGYSNWGTSESKACHFDVTLTPTVLPDRGFQADQHEVCAKLSFPNETQSTIGRCSMKITDVNDHWIMFEGGHLDGEALFVLRKDTDLIKVEAMWIDNEMGPNRYGECVLERL